MTDQSSTQLLRDGELTAIAQLNPEISNQQKRVVDGTVTITWPFSIIKKSIAFLLAERDFRLRREKGQVRIHFHGPAAKAIADASLGGGDDIRLSLEGAKWETNETQTQVAGNTLEWQLEYANRLILSYRRPETEEETVIKIDLTATDPETTNGDIEITSPVEPIASNSDLAIPPPQSPDVSLHAKRSAPSSLEPPEFASPAFLKRARVSYGSLFEGGLDIFDEDVAKKAKSKKSTRFSLPANAWRYNSHSPSPEPDEIPEEAGQANEVDGPLQQNGLVEDTPMLTPPRPPMVDQGCQTADVDFTPMASVQVLAESRPIFGFPQSTPTPLPRTKPIDPDNDILDHSLRFQEDPSRQQHAHHQPQVDFLGTSPGHVDTGDAFGFTPQTLLFPSAPGLFPLSQDRDAGPETPSHGTRVENYPPEFLDASHLASNTPEIHSNLPAHDSHINLHTAGHQVSFDTDPALHTVFAAISQTPQRAWATEVSSEPVSTAIVSTDVEHPMEILSSSPLRERGSSEERRSAAPGETDDGDLTEDASPEPVLEEPALEEPASEAEHYKDGGDEPGDDYDLRNYDRAHDDDDDIETSEEEQDYDGDEPEAQIMNPEEEEADEDEELEAGLEGELDRMPNEYDENMYEEGFEGEGQEYEGSDGDAEGEYYSDEEGSYDEDEEEEQETGSGPPRASAPQEPVFISLLSDSEDEDEQPPEPEPEPEQQELEQQELGRTAELEQTKESRSVPDDRLKEDSEDDGEKEPVGQPEAELESLAKRSPSASLEETTQANEAGDTSNPLPEKQDTEVSLPALTMEVDTEPSQVAAVPDATGDRGSDDAPRGKEITDGESARQNPPIQSPQSKPEQGPQQEQGDKETDAVPEKTESGDLDMADAPALASSFDSSADKEAAGVNDSDEEQPATTEGPTEAMDVDETHEATNDEDNEPTTTTSLEITDTTVVVSEEGRGTIAEGALTSLADGKGRLAGEQMFAEPHITSENGVEPLESPMPPVPGVFLAGESDGATPVTREEAGQTPEAQGQEPVESPDATMQDASLEVTQESELQPATAVGQMVTAESVGATSTDERPTTHGQMSPPPTQVSHAQQQSQNNEEETTLLSQATTVISNEEHSTYLATPSETQPCEEIETTETIITTVYDIQVDADEIGPDDQIMSEILQHSPARGETLQHANSAKYSPSESQPKSSPRTELTETPHDTPSKKAQRAPETAVATKSLRSRRHRSARSSDQGDHAQVDPSILLAKASAASRNADNDVKCSSPVASVRKTRSRPERGDPSIQLARASMNPDDNKGKGKRKLADDESVVSAENSSPASLRTTRHKVDHGDPSILLAKASSPSTRQTRSHRTPDVGRETPKRETRSSSRALQLPAETPGASSVALKSPSIAGSTATATEDENAGVIKLQLLKSLRTSLPEYLSLKLLRNSLNKTADILAVATSTPEQPHRPKHGPRDYMLTLNLTDPSVAPTGVCVAHIFRPHQASLPVVNPGDVVLLRRVQVVAMKGRGFGVRTGDTSAWAVFEKADQEMLPQIKGPPVECTEDEVKYAEGLQHWWNLQDQKAMDKIERASRKVTEAGKDDTR
ncbi:hypothetical protein FZEAL_9465 [Fusarium zealandicum]|uniref:Telomeric single stranded DNA binding POT1/Cdc13 domain-containing protein n=1 Tax=Fusarium zealandicum TaxID=1053134 RepID=A0A8H4XG77_9HYPO|nr:hypothetical protein FZEAL_9465 [Fusarium zealandicum]